MDLLAYIKLLHRRWVVVVSVALAVFAVSALYLLVAPRVYTTTASMIVTVNDPSDVNDAQQGVSSANSLAPTYAAVIDSAVVVAPTSASLYPALPLRDALNMISTSVRTGTAIIDVSAAGSDPELVTRLVNGVTERAVDEIPALQGRSAANSPISIKPVQFAQQPESPSSPDTSRVLALGVVLGLLTGIAFTIALEMFIEARRLDG